MRKVIVLLMLSSGFLNVTHAQSAAKAAYVEIGGPGLLSVNYDMRFASKENGAGFRVGVGAFSVNSASVVTVPLGLNYLIGKDKKNYFEVGAGFTYLSVSEKNKKTSKTFKSSFGDVTLGYRLAPAKGGFFFKAEITPVFGDGFFIPYFGGIGLGYKF
jgi:hypothetical protein